jgi:hypothetical protein
MFARELVRSYRAHVPEMKPINLPADLATVYRPGVQLHNLAYDATRFRKIHIETEHVGMVHAVHSTMYPRLQYDAPILTMDIIALGDHVEYAFLDACAHTVHPEYAAAFRDIQIRYGLSPAPRHAVPEYGRSIFSRNCFLRTHGIDPLLFTQFALECVAMHVRYVDMLESSSTNNISNHQRFSRQQRLNPRKRSFVSTALGGDTVLTDAYLHMMFQ